MAVSVSGTIELRQAASRSGLVGGIWQGAVSAAEDASAGNFRLELDEPSDSGLSVRAMLITHLEVRRSTGVPAADRNCQLWIQGKWANTINAITFNDIRTMRVTLNALPNTVQARANLTGQGRSLTSEAKAYGWFLPIVGGGTNTALSIFFDKANDNDGTYQMLASGVYIEVGAHQLMDLLRQGA